MNKTISEFLSKQNIDLNKINKLDEKRVQCDKDINPIIYNNEIFKNNNETKKVCIADIKGYDYNFMRLDNDSLIENMSTFFNEGGGGYETRSISMLDYSTDEIIEKLSNSFEIEPMCINEADEKKYVIGDNGLHRFHVIKAHYLKELSQINQNDADAIEKLKNKYMIDVRVSELDLFKTYASFILKRLAEYQNKKIRIETEYDRYWNVTGNVIVEQFGQNQSSQVMNDKELSIFMKKYIVDFILNKSVPRKTYKSFFKEIKNACKNYDSFKEFYTQHLQKTIDQLNNLKKSCAHEEEFE